MTLLRVTNDILRTIDRRQDVVLVLLDLSAAFDTIYVIKTYPELLDNEKTDYFYFFKHDLRVPTYPYIVEWTRSSFSKMMGFSVPLVEDLGAQLNHSQSALSHYVPNSLRIWISSISLSNKSNLKQAHHLGSLR